MIAIEASTVATGKDSPYVGSAVTYVDEYSVEHRALITACWGPDLGKNAVNVVYVSGDASQSDPYGRQIARASSVSPEGPHTAHGRYYRVIS